MPALGPGPPERGLFIVRVRRAGPGRWHPPSLLCRRSWPQSVSSFTGDGGSRWARAFCPWGSWRGGGEQVSIGCMERVTFGPQLPQFPGTQCTHVPAGAGAWLEKPRCCLECGGCGICRGWRSGLHFISLSKPGRTWGRLRTGRPGPWAPCHRGAWHHFLGWCRRGWGPFSVV